MRLSLAHLARSVCKSSEYSKTFARQWLLFDAKHQNPFESAEKIADILAGKNKPIYHRSMDTGDHVVVINCKEISMPWYEWKFRMYYHHTDFAQGGSWTAAWELHDKDPTKVLYKAVYRALPGDLTRRPRMERLHLYAAEVVPQNIMENVTTQIRQLRPVPRKLADISEEEKLKYPKLFDYPNDHVL